MFEYEAAAICECHESGGAVACIVFQFDVGHGRVAALVDLDPAAELNPTLDLNKEVDLDTTTVADLDLVVYWMRRWAWIHRWI